MPSLSTGILLPHCGQGCSSFRSPSYGGVILPPKEEKWLATKQSERGVDSLRQGRSSPRPLVPTESGLVRTTRRHALPSTSLRAGSMTTGTLNAEERRTRRDSSTAEHDALFE